MTVSKYEVLALLPDYKDQWVVVVDDQYVDDIIEDILYVQRNFGSYYDLFSYKFLAGTVPEICDNIYKFLQKSIRYKEETVKVQSTALPTGILERGFGDCKHFAAIAGGILGSLNRMYDAQIDWCFAFASYDRKIEEPYHVFVIVKDRKGEIWIDPTPGAGPVPWLLIKEYA